MQVWQGLVSADRWPLNPSAPSSLLGLALCDFVPSLDKEWAARVDYPLRYETNPFVHHPFVGALRVRARHDALRDASPPLLVFTLSDVLLQIASATELRCTVYPTRRHTALARPVASL